MMRLAMHCREGIDGMKNVEPDKVELDEQTLHEIWNALHNRNVLIAWKPEYEQGIFIIDEQHRGITSVINSLYYAMRTDQGTDMLLPVIEMVTAYTRIHFTMEEDCHRKCGFPDTEQHQHFHSELIAKMSRIGRKSVEGKDPYQFMSFLKEWWNNHICNEDKAFREYLLSMAAKVREKHGN